MIAFALVLLPFSPWYVGGKERNQSPAQGSIST